ncbi:MAG: recombinase family protein [Flavobacteriaceae bacterium]|nr:recombinase family protein [Flavobacteriaceae bacterium]
MKPNSLLYVRCSTIKQNTDRQFNDYGKSFKEDFQFFLEDKESGSVPIFERKNGKLMKVMIDGGRINHIHIHQIDRCARNLKSLLEFIEYTSERGVNVFFKKEGINTLGEDGKTSYMVKMMISVMGAFAEVENEIRKERQTEGIRIAIAHGRYDNRTKRGKETPQRFLMKHSKAVEYLRRGMKGSEVIRLLDNKINKNTITKIKKHLHLDITV